MSTVRVRHYRSIGYCARGVRAWFATTPLSWQTFLDEGYPSDVIRAQGNALADRMADAADAEEAAARG